MKIQKSQNKIQPSALSQRIAVTILATVVSAVAINAGKPKLLVGIVVDGLQQERLDLLRPHLSKNGFNRFLNEGVVIDNIDFGTNVDAATATAILMTGTSPNVNGVSGELVYEPTAKRVHHVFNDNSTMGNFTQETLSPKALRVSTLSDEARIAGAGVTYVHAISPDAAQAIVMGSHAGNSAIWFNEKTGNWASSVYYRDMPVAAMNANRTQPLSYRLETLEWTPSTVTASASDLPEHLVKYPFRYTFSQKDADKYAKYAGTPLINQDITKLAKEYITGLELGRHEGTDVLNIAYNLQPYEWSKNPESRYEQYDSYVKLDESLSQLFDLIDKTVGRENAIIYLSGTPLRSQRRKDDVKWNIPGGEFSSRKAMSILNLYLIALHGNGEWVKAFHNGNFYLNNDLAKSLNKDISQIRRQAAECLMKMSGVGSAYTIDDIIRSTAQGTKAEGKMRNTIVSQSGDVIVELIPGWSLVDDFNIPNHKPTTTYVQAPSTASFMISAPGYSPKRIETTVDARAIAPAISGMLHIRSPNGANVPAVNLK